MQRQVRPSLLHRAKGYIASRKLRCAMVALGILAVILTALYIWYSVTAWQSLSARSDEVRGSIKNGVARLEQKTHKIEEVSQVATRLRADIDTTCAVSPFIQWHVHVVASTDTLFKECRSQQESFRDTHRALASIYARAMSEQEFAQRMTETWRALDALEPADHEGRLAQWKEAGVALDALELHASLDNAQAAALMATTEIITSYDSLVVANKSEDRAAFDEASDALNKGYSKLGAVQNHSVESYDSLIDKSKAVTSTL